MALRQQSETEDRADLSALDRIQAHDTDAFSDIVGRYTPVLYSLAFRMLGADPDAAREAVQDIFLRVYRALDAFDRNKRLFPWIYTIALNHLRSVKRASRAALRRPAVDVDGRRGLAVVDDSPRPDELTEGREGERLAQKALDGLAPKLREAFLLRHVEGLPTRDVADILGVPEATVRTWVFRAREQMRSKLLDSGWM